jgi:hypothetical protein
MPSTSPAERPRHVHFVMNPPLCRSNTEISCGRRSVTTRARHSGLSCAPPSPPVSCISLFYGAPRPRYGGSAAR